MDDYTEQAGQPQEDDADERRRRFNLRIGAGIKPTLPPGGNDVTLDSAALAPGSRGYDLAVGATNQPRIPAPRFSDPMAPTAPDIGSSIPALGSRTPLGVQPAQPVRPNVAPQRSDYVASPEMSGWKKYLGLGLSALAGPQAAGPLAEKILHGQRDKANQLYQQDTQDWERGLSDQARQAQTEETQARTQALRNPKPDKPENLDREAYDFYVQGGMTPAEARKQVLADAADQKPDKTKPFEQQTYEEWLTTHPGGTRLQFSKDLATAKQTPERPEKPQRQLAITPDNKVIELTPGMAVPPGTKSLSGELNLTSKTEQGEQAGKAATAYANDYLTGKQWTGPGDEALMEKFFEMAKPSSGFRMTQAQIEMLQKSRDWMGSMTAKAKHAFTPEAPWFSDTQRKQIVKTMNDLARSRESVNPAAANTGGKGQVVVTDPSGGQHTFPDQASADRFKKLAKIQ
jgi:hypothetical protein